jgi:hypothetical protein
MELSRPMRLCVYREKSQSTKNLCEAMCQASLRFAPLHMDSTGRDEDGSEYRYASLNAIKKATSHALWESGVWTHAEYGFNDRGRFICVTIEKDDEWVASYLDIPDSTSLRKRKGLMTQLRKAAIEGLLDLAAEQDTDAEVTDDGPAGDPLALLNAAKGWADMKRMAKDAIAAAANEKTVQAKIAKVREKVEAGDMNPADLKELADFAEARIAEIQAAAEKAGIKPVKSGGAA